MYCKKCGARNDEDSLFCKHCGFPIGEHEMSIEDEIKKQNNQNSEISNDKKNKSPKTKNKTKNKTKHKTKNKIKKEKPRKNSNQQNEKGMNAGQKFLMFILFLMVFSLIGVLGAGSYYLYKERNIEVPNLINMTYEEAENALSQKNLKIKKVEKETQNENEENIVLEQNKKPGKKVRKNTTVKVIVGKYKEISIVEDFTGMNIETVITTLESKNIKYEINYKETEDYENGIIISQTPKAGKELTETDKIVLTVAQNTSTTEKTNKDNQEDPNIIEETQEEPQEQTN